MGDTFELSAAKMREQGMSEIAINQFAHLYDSWINDKSGEFIRENTVEPIKSVPNFHEIYETIDHDKAVNAFAKTAFIKLNGGLGTSMGLSCAKSLLPVRRHKARQMRFIDIIIGQVLTARQRLGVDLPLIFMNSFRTSKDTLQVLKRNRKFSQENIPVEIIQHQEPKLLEETCEPVSYPEDPELEWCPPGHGDIFSTICESGLLNVLKKNGIEYLFISNSDNLGARPSRTLAQHFENTGASIMIEVAKRTQADRKGGHIVRDLETGRMMLREMTQVHPEDRRSAQSIKKHPYFNTNNIWVRVDALQKKLEEYNGVLPLPVICNRKTIDPTNEKSEKVIQLETAMGAAISLFNDAICVEVDRMRFLPVKTTNDLFIMRSDRFHLTDSYEMEDGNYIFPDIDLDPRYYRNINDFNERFPYSVPALAAAKSVTIRGDWTFGNQVSMFSDAVLEDTGEPSYVPNGEFVGPQGIEPDEWV
ncbi:UTP--glucose-1-phosphate uridylyltransferase [Gardnerella vaginalis]|uniref:UTP--glucose-1-phosphate uridylyltransferase n=1 Tax=Gardnerella vaginalis TaxID=2702 RepID=UPI000352A1A9|nr:UTP--glucose-1-phosphate uridylyltransferase [Gardnerella vaginalis]EPI56954.1 UTP--glucose-1-phosphate uridylyltransferase [Gardnerella vaginalis JCP7276]MDK8338092.1 UTP--glucose-1-phosphate uridylyltransferase [Gardnerella vaginalis]PKZ56897.1 UTP--glucose-1-phosphate uridylyltransferase [Gardnerella vaginalis]PKZ74200.1 UTP--glucose-1-phosphate uridylyltransferase [Gardnerella vaginalis]